jgi:hypothetical protein
MKCVLSCDIIHQALCIHWQVHRVLFGDSNLHGVAIKTTRLSARLRKITGLRVDDSRPIIVQLRFPTFS